MIADTLVGTVVDGRFEIRDKLGQGGMGAVYRAWQRSTEREVAIKLIAKQQVSEPMAIERFLREARLASQLAHPNTISVYDFGKLADGRLFIAMELIKGHTLGRELKTVGALAFDRIVRIAIQICDALAAAHALKIVHRDLKPDNVMLIENTADLIKVLDFGLAKRLDDKSLKGTAAGIVVGTPRYIPPEAMMTGITYPEGDLYALGVIVGEMALGRPLWRGSELGELLTQQMKPAEHIRDIPEPLHGIVASLLDPTPAMRPTAIQLRERLVAMQSGAMPRYRPSQPPPAAMNTVPPTVRATPAAIPDTAPPTVPNTPAAIPNTVRGTPGKIPETPATQVFKRAKPPTADVQPSPWARPHDRDARPAERARPPSAAPPTSQPVPPNVGPVPGASPAKPRRSPSISYAGAGAMVLVAAVALLVNRSQSSSPPQSTTPQPKPPQPTAHDPWAGSGASLPDPTPVDAAVETATSDEPSGSGVTASKPVTTPTPTKPTATQAAKKKPLLSPTECMAIRDQPKQYECLRAYCAQNPIDALCDLEYSQGPLRPTPVKKVPSPPKKKAVNHDDVVDPFAEDTRALSTILRDPKEDQPAKKPGAKPTSKPCDTCIERPD